MVQPPSGGGGGRGTERPDGLRRSHPTTRGLSKVANTNAPGSTSRKMAAPTAPGYAMSPGPNIATSPDTNMASAPKTVRAHAHRQPLASRSPRRGRSKRSRRPRSSAHAVSRGCRRYRRRGRNGAEEAKEDQDSAHHLQPLWSRGFTGESSHGAEPGLPMRFRHSAATLGSRNEESPRSRTTFTGWASPHLTL